MGQTPGAESRPKQVLGLVSFVVGGRRSPDIRRIDLRGRRRVLRQIDLERAREHHHLEDNIEKEDRSPRAVSLQKVQRDFRAMDSGSLEVRPVFVM
jgi:hypothetical protein